MRISEMTNDQATDAMIRLASAFSVIFEDKNTEKFLTDIDGKEWKYAIKSVIPHFVAYALSEHKNELYEVVGALNAVPVSEVGGMNFFETVKSVQNSWDDVLKNFFTSSVTAKRGKENA